MSRRQRPASYLCQRINSHFQQALQTGPDHIKRQIKYCQHDQYKARNRSILTCKDLVHPFTAKSFFTLNRFYYRALTNPLDKVKTHICNRCAAVQPPFFFHLQDQVLQCFLFILVQSQAFQDQWISFNQFCSCKPHRNICLPGMVFYNMADSMNTAMHCTTKLIFITKILSSRLFLVSCNMDGMSYQFLHSLVLGC